MGTVVFPDATLKVFLTASADERAERRHKQLMTKGIHANIGRLLRDMRGARRARQRARSVAPLKRAADAMLLDTTEPDRSTKPVDQMVLAWYADSGYHRLP